MGETWEKKYREAALKLVGSLRDERGRTRIYVGDHGQVTRPAPGAERFAWVEVLLLVYDEDLEGGEHEGRELAGGSPSQGG